MVTQLVYLRNSKRERNFQLAKKLQIKMNEIYYQKPPTVTRKDTIYNDQCPVFHNFDKTKHFTLVTTFSGNPKILLPYGYWYNGILNPCFFIPYNGEISFQKYHELAFFQIYW